MRSFIEGLPEKPEKVITRKTGLLGDLVQAQRMVVAVVDKIACTTKPLKCFEIRQRAGVYSSNHAVTVSAAAASAKPPR